MRNESTCRSRGSALISVLLLAAVLAVLGTASLSLAEGGARRASARRGIDRAYYAAEGAALLAAERLALTASLHGASGDNASAVPKRSDAAFTVPYMDAANIGVSAQREKNGYMIHTRAIVAEGECDIIAYTDENGGIIRLSTER